MATVWNRASYRAVVGMIAIATTGFITYSVLQRPHRLDSEFTPRDALSFPYNMVFS